MPPRVTAVLLAAGSAARMGRLKQLLPVGDRPAICCCLDAIEGAGIEKIVVVLGPQAEAVINVIGPFPKIVVNRNPQSEMVESLRIGLRAVDGNAEAVLICLADHPAVSSHTIEALIKESFDRPGDIIIPTYQGRRGHPCLFPRDLLPEIMWRSNLRETIRAHRVRTSLCEVKDVGVVMDMDTQEDYARLVAHMRGTSSV